MSAPPQTLPALSPRRIVAIYPDGEEEAQCIQIDDPSGLYITDDYIVTHNSSPNEAALQKAADTLLELASDEGFSSIPTSQATTLEGVFADALPQVESLGEDTRSDERSETKADHRYVFRLPTTQGKRTFYVYTTDNGKVWIDVSRLEEGDGGQRIYGAVADFAHNTGQVFTGDPLGLSEAAVIRRSVAMLESALRHGTTRHLDAADEQIAGNPKTGIEPLRWRGSENDKLKALIKTVSETALHRFPALRNYRYDFDSNQYLDGKGNVVGDERFNQAEQLGVSRVSKAGAKSLRRAIFLKSLIEEEAGSFEKITARIFSGYDPVRPGPLFSVATPANGNPPGSNAPWSPKAPGSLFDQIVYQFQDKFIDLKKVIAAIEATGKKVADTMNTYARETLMHGRISLAVQDFKQNEIKPILEALEKNKVDIKTFEQYLHARHAHERNAAMAKLHPTQAEINARITQLDAAIQAGKRANTNTAKLESERDALQNTAPWSGTLDDRNKLSGMSDQDAANILRTTPKAPLMRHLADRVDDMTRKTRHEMLAYGLETAETVDALDRAYQHYVPLFRDMEESDLLGSGNGSGQGLNVRGSSIRRATGSLREVEHIFAHLAQQREAVIARGEKNLVQQSLWNLVTDNPNAAFWAAISPKMSADQMRQALLQTGSDPSDVNDIVRSLTEPVIDRVTGVVRTRVKSTIARMPNVVSLRINGEDRLIVLSRKNDTAVRLAQALRNEDQAWFPSGAALSEVGRVTRWLASVNTQYNPVFGMTNFTRDIQESLINLSSTELAGKQGDVLKGIWSAGTAIWATVRGKNPSGPWAKYYREFLESGAATGYRDSYANIEDRAKAIEAEMYGKGIRNATGRRLSRCTLISAQSAPGAV